MAIQANSAALKRYYEMLDEAARQGQTHEGNVRRAFESLLRETAKEAKGWELVTEQTERREANAVRYDGTLRDGNRLPHGWWEAKDSSDDLDNEIRRKKDRGYRFDNIIFEDTRRAVLYQDGLEVVRAEVRDAAKLADLLNRFYSHEIEPFTQFYEAVAYFQEEIPHIAQGLKAKIEGAHHDNKRFQTAYAAFMELCKTALNPNISQAAVDEMLIQHMLTERLIRKVFDVEEFNRRNVIAAEVEGVIDSLASQHFNRSQFLGALDRFYTAIEQAADRLATFSEKQDFINHVYERFFQGYSVKIADTHGIVYTPQPIVDFMCAAVEEVLLNEFGKRLGDEDIYVIDPCTGTGNFAVNLLRRAHERNPRGFEQFYRQQLFANEVMLMPYYIASLNIEHEYYALTGRYEPFEGVCFVDTLDLAERVDGQMGLTGFLTEKNTARVERQKAAPITVIIGNPPYNVGQLNENDNNKNRKYEVIDKRVKETYAKDSKATNKNALSDAYVKFFRWAADRLQGRDGIVCYVSNNGFIDSIAFDGMRKHLLEDFTQIYVVDLKGNIRKDSMRDGIPLGEQHTVFGQAAMVGISISVLVRKQKHKERKLFYKTVDFRSTREEKFAFLKEHVVLDGRQNSLNTIEWEQLRPDARHTWLVPEHGEEYESFLLMGSKETKSAKTNTVEAIFKTYSGGVKTNRDDVVYDFDRKALSERVQGFIERYNAEVDRYKRAGSPKDVDHFVKYDAIKWSEGLKGQLQRGNYSTFEPQKIRRSLYRPFEQQYLYFDSMLNERRYQFPSIFPTAASEQENRVICLSGVGHDVFVCLMSSQIIELKTANQGNGGSQCFPFYVYDADGGNRRENITDWALGVFRGRYALTPVPSPSGRGEKGGSLGAVGRGGIRKSGGERGEKDGSGDGRGEIRKGGDGRWGVREGEGGRGDKAGRGGEEEPEVVIRAKATAAMKAIARNLRQRQTPAEAILWEALRDRRLDELKFRRQHALENTPYVVDFLCYEARLVVELDGGIHETQIEDDAIRQAAIEAAGYRVLRFSNEAIYADLETVLTRIMREAQTRLLEDEPNRREISKWDIFYYVYALLHHPEYRAKFADNLKRELPRIPMAPDFWAFADAGRALADLHLHYETVEPYPLEWVVTPGKAISYRVEKMRFGKAAGTLIYNDTLTLAGIPEAAFEYKLGNRSALHWLVDQYQVSVDGRSGIVSDPNAYSDDERYIVTLVERVVRVSVETVRIVGSLPAFVG